MLGSCILNHYTIIDYLQRGLHTQWEYSEYLYLPRPSEANLKYGWQCLIPTVKCIDESSKKPLLILSLCLVKQLLQYLHLNSPWLSFKRKIKHFVQVFLGWFSFLRWGYRDSFILSRHSYWQKFPTRISRLTGWHPCDCLSLYPSVLKPTSIHRPQIHGLSRRKERADKSQSKQYILNGNKVLSFSWEI